MQAVVDELAEFIGRHCPLPAAEPAELTERKLLVESAGDIAAMLHLPERQALFPLQRVTIGQVVQADDRLWEPDKTADILLLGDSFTNIYSLAEMRWGTAAGLAERLSFALRRPVDRLAQNDGGAHAVRQALAQQIARGNDRLAGKRIVIWQFAARELASGDWKRVPLPERVPAGDARHRPADPSTDSRGSAGDTGELLVRGVARAASGAPQPGSVPYRDAITSIQLVEIEPQSGSLDAREIVVYLWGMRDNRWTSAARWKPGQKLTLRLTPWESVEKDYGRINRVDLDDPEFRLIDLPVYWGEEVSAPSHQR
jgi:alginate O-acetyltransferase complex protein AlgJ